MAFISGSVSAHCRSLPRCVMVPAKVPFCEHTWVPYTGISPHWRNISAPPSTNSLSGTLAGEIMAILSPSFKNAGRTGSWLCRLGRLSITIIMLIIAVVIFIIMVF